MTTVDKTAATDAEFEARIAPFEPNRETYTWQVHEVPVPVLEMAPVDIFLCACGDPDDCKQIRP